MRYRHVVLALFAVLPGMKVLATPYSGPSAILDIGPPSKGETAEKHRKDEIGYLTSLPGMLCMALRDPEVLRLPSVARLKDARPWLSENLKVTPVSGSNRLLRLRFRAGSHAEQRTILNVLLRINIRLVAENRKMVEEKLCLVEKAVPRLEKLVISQRINGAQRARYRKDLDATPSHTAELRTEIARRKQFAVIKWAK